MVDRVPAVLRILRTIRPKYACRACEGTVVQAKARPRLIESGMASTALVAWIASAKFAWGSTLYRQAQILAGHGLNIDRQTLARWMKQAAWTVKGLYEVQLAPCTVILACSATKRRCGCSILGEAEQKSASSDGVDGAPSGIKRAKMVVVKTSSEESRPWASLTRNW